MASYKLINTQNITRSRVVGSELEENEYAFGGPGFKWNQNPRNDHVYEIKTDNIEHVKEGLKQLDRYAHERSNSKYYLVDIGYTGSLDDVVDSLIDNNLFFRENVWLPQKYVDHFAKRLERDNFLAARYNFEQRYGLLKDANIETVLSFFSTKDEKNCASREEIMDLWQTMEQKDEWNKPIYFLLHRTILETIFKRLFDDNEKVDVTKLSDCGHKVQSKQIPEFEKAGIYYLSGILGPACHLEVQNDKNSPNFIRYYKETREGNLPYLMPSIFYLLLSIIMRICNKNIETRDSESQEQRERPGFVTTQNVTMSHVVGSELKENEYAYGGHNLEKQNPGNNHVSRIYTNNLSGIENGLIKLKQEAQKKPENKYYLIPIGIKIGSYSQKEVVDLLIKYDLFFRHNIWLPQNFVNQFKDKLRCEYSLAVKYSFEQRYKLIIAREKKKLTQEEKKKLTPEEKVLSFFDTEDEKNSFMKLWNDMEKKRWNDTNNFLVLRNSLETIFKKLIEMGIIKNKELYYCAKQLLSKDVPQYIKSGIYYITQILCLPYSGQQSMDDTKYMAYFKEGFEGKNIYLQPAIFYTSLSAILWCQREYEQWTETNKKTTTNE